MNATPGMETFVVGVLCGGVLGAAAALSRRFLGLVFGLGAALILFVLVDQGAAGLEAQVRRLIEEALRHQHMLFGAVLGLVLAASFFNRGTPRREVER